jgi:TolB protein
MFLNLKSIYKGVLIATSLFVINVQAIEIKIEKKEAKIPVYIESNNIDLRNQIVSNLSKIKKINIINNKTKNSFNFKAERLKNKDYIYFKKESFISNKPMHKIRANSISDFIYNKIFNKKSFFEEKLVFVKKEKSKYKLTVSDYEGTVIKTVLVSPEPILSPDISSDGNFITYVSFENVRPSVYIHNIKTKDRKIIANYKGVNGYPKISNDNKNVLLSISKNGTADLYEYNIKSNALKRLTKESGNEISPEWINNDDILFASDRNGNPSVFKYNRKTNKVSKFYKTKKYTLSPTYNRDNTVSIFLHKGFYGLVSKNNKTQDEIILIKDFYIESPSITKNGNIIVYATKENNKSVLNFIDNSGEKLYSLKYKNADIIEPSF